MPSVNFELSVLYPVLYPGLYRVNFDIVVDSDIVVATIHSRNQFAGKSHGSNQIDYFSFFPKFRKTDLA